MAAALDPQDPSLLACPECRGHGYVVDLIGEVRPCRSEECMRARAVEILEESGGEGRDRGANLDDALGGLLKGNAEFRKLAGSFVMGGLAGVVAKLGADILADAVKEEKTSGSSKLLPSRRPASPHCAGVRCWYDNGAPCRCECEGCTQVSEWPKPYRVARPKPAKRSKKKPSRRR